MRHADRSVTCKRRPSIERRDIREAGRRARVARACISPARALTAEGLRWELVKNAAASNKIVDGTLSRPSGRN